MTAPKHPPRTYNQIHAPRKYSPGRRRVSVYITWSYPAEANRDVNVLDNRFSTMAEVRRVAWPDYESPEYANPKKFLQGIAGSLELFFRAWERFQAVVGEVTEHVVPVYQRIDQAGYELLLDERVLSDTDTLLVFGLDHLVTDQEAKEAEITAVREFLTREGTCLVLGPHHDVGVSDDIKERQMEYVHHGDALVPRQQRFGRYARSLMKGLGVPVENRYGLRPAVSKGTNKIAPLSIAKDLDTRGWLEGVTAFNFHMHLPHYALTTDDTKSIHVLARQPIDMSNPHPFTEAGNHEFNTFVWMPPSGKRAGDILLADSTIFSTLFAGEESLERFWKNIAMR
ncbi:hypothetical protein IY145_13280 [Methylosinus sp. H3A]|uniref:hypothetical protein n=1 Tax=Methylosinus sp. H3A TaxID=2785786 RepID=UPI0018C280D2|nr:hypothetical protein [Methylosinus sp. H3A]MBG0810346.1 hypothetical protein [Methylosinus sp. H3A]